MSNFIAELNTTDLSGNGPPTNVRGRPLTDAQREEREPTDWSALQDDCELSYVEARPVKGNRRHIDTHDTQPGSSTDGERVLAKCWSNEHFSRVRTLPLLSAPTSAESLTPVQLRS